MYILLPLFFGVLSLPGILLYLGVTYRTSALGITCLIFTFFGIIIVLLAAMGVVLEPLLYGFKALFDFLKYLLLLKWLSRFFGGKF